MRVGEDVPEGRHALDPSGPSARVQLIVAVLWCIGFVSYVGIRGFSLDPYTMMFWAVTGLIAFTYGRRPWWQAPLDWSPFMIFLLGYDYTRGAARRLGFPTHWHAGPDFDRWLYHGTIPTVWLQERFAAPFDAVPWWEAFTGIIYMSHFVVSFVLAAVLWVRSRRDFTRFMVRLAAVSFLALACFVVIPAAPPWAAARCTPAQVADRPYDPPCLHHAVAPHPQNTLLGELKPRNTAFPHNAQRLSGRGWKRIPVLGRGQALINTGIDGSNRVAAVPSLHAATAALIAVFLWPRVPRRWRGVLLAYPFAMAVVLMWDGDHYTFDIFAGWSVVLVVMVGVGQAERWWRRRTLGASAHHVGLASE